MDQLLPAKHQTLEMMLQKLQSISINSQMCPNKPKHLQEGELSMHSTIFNH